MSIDIRGPFIAKKGYLEVVAFYEAEYLLVLFPFPYWSTNEKTESPFQTGDTIEVPEGKHIISQVEIIPPLNTEQLEQELRENLRQKHVIFTNRIIAGYRYKINKAEDRK